VRAIRIQYNAFLFFSFCTIITTYREYEGQANTIIGLAFFFICHHNSIFCIFLFESILPPQITNESTTITITIIICSYKIYIYIYIFVDFHRISKAKAMIMTRLS
jgi:hypothetical protein